MGTGGPHSFGQRGDHRGTRVIPINIFTTLNYPFATNGTTAYGINGSGQIVGNYEDGSGNHGFLLDYNSPTSTTTFTVNS